MSVANRARTALWRVPVGLQLSALYTLLLVAILALLGWALYTQLDHFLAQDTAARLNQAAWSAAHNPGLGRGEPGDPGRHFNVPNQAPNQPAPSLPPSPAPDRAALFLVRELSAPDVTVAVLNPQGALIASTQDFDSNDPRALPTLPDGWTDKVAGGSAQSVDTQQTTQWILPAPVGGRQLVVVQPVSVPASPGGTLTRLLLLQAASLDAADALLGQLRLYLALGILIGTVVGVFAGLALTRAVLKPLDRMAHTAEAIAQGDLDRRLRMPVGRNEIARLGGAFDFMVDRLAATLQAQRRFVADASHELRTPLTSLEGLSEMLLIGADRGDSRAVQRMVRSIHSELGRMARLVSDLLALSRLDSAAPMSLVSVDAGKMLDDVAEQVAPLAEARQIELKVTRDGPVLVQAEPDRLKQVILNLVDNALRYTPPKGEMALSAVHDPSNGSGGTARIEVRDTGPGIAPEDLPHIFDRFYRGDPSRARATGNTGLGLAIARAIVQAHSGAIEVRSTPGTGTCFTIILPAGRSDEQHPATAATKRKYHAVSNQVR